MPAKRTTDTRETNRGSRSTRPGEVRSLLRGLDVLGAVNDFAPASVSQIVQATDLPKATVIRLLGTLRQGGYVRQDPVTSLYLPLPAVRRLAGALRQSASFAELADEMLNEYGQQISWPCELLLAESDAMAIVASNRKTSPIQLRLFEQRRFAMLDSAGGIAFLSALPPGQRQRVIMRLSAAPDSDPAAGRARAADAFQAVNDTQRRGYSVHNYLAPVSGMRAVGVPIHDGKDAVGALVVLTLAGVVSTAIFEKELLAGLLGIAGRLGQLFADTEDQSPQ